MLATDHMVNHQFKETSSREQGSQDSSRPRGIKDQRISSRRRVMEK